jgi:hypothetical protein
MIAQQAVGLPSEISKINFLYCALESIHDYFFTNRKISISLNKSNSKSICSDLLIRVVSTIAFKKWDY